MSGRYRSAMEDQAPWWIPHLISALALIAAAASAVFAGFTWRTSTRSAEAAVDSAKAAEVSAAAAADNARITKADALVCQVDLRLQFGDQDSRFQKGGMRQIRVVNHGKELAFAVSLDPESTEIKVEEYPPKDLGWNEGTNVSFFEPDGDGPHYFVFTFRRPWELGGEEKTVSLKYDREALS